MNLILATIWLAVAFGLFYWSWADPEHAQKIPGTGLSLGWFALLMFLYNVIRWWTLHRTTAQHRRLREAAARLEAERNAGTAPGRVTDPTFDFSERNPPRPPEPPGPSVN